MRKESRSRKLKGKERKSKKLERIGMKGRKGTERKNNE